MSNPFLRKNKEKLPKFVMKACPKYEWVILDIESRLYAPISNERKELFIISPIKVRDYQRDFMYNKKIFNRSYHSPYLFDRRLNSGYRGFCYSLYPKEFYQNFTPKTVAEPPEAYKGLFVNAS